MQISLEFVDRGIWNAIINESYILMHVINNVHKERFFLWTADETKESQYDVKT